MGKESLLATTDGGDPNPSQMINEEVYEEPGESDGLKSLFDETITEADLMGDDDPVKPEETPVKDQTPEEDPEKSTSDKDTGDGDSKDGKDKEGDDDKDKDTEPDKPPKGFVPLKALHEERRARQGLQDEIQELRDALDEMRAEADEDFDPDADADPKEDFKVLTKEEYETLNQEDPVAAIQYKLDLRDYKDAKKQIESQREFITNSVQAGYEKVLELIPEIAEEDNTVADDIEAYATKHGIDSRVFMDMANPSTMVVDANGRHRPLGTDAADFISLLYKAMEHENTYETTLEEKIRKEVEAELLEKFKAKGSNTNFKSIDDAPSASDAPTGGLADLTEASFRKLTLEEREEALRGA